MQVLHDWYFFTEMRMINYFGEPGNSLMLE